MTQYARVKASHMVELASTVPSNLLRAKNDLYEARPQAEARVPFIVAYLRRSKKKENDSIERQRARANEYSLRRFGTEVHAFYMDKGKSGKFRNRKDLRRLKDDVVAGIITVLIVEDLDRLGRTMALIAGECEYFADNNVAVHTVKKGDVITNADIALNGFMASETLTLLLQRVSSGLQEFLDEGGITSRCFGYDAVPGKPGERTVDERARAAIQWMFQARLDGMGFTQIARVLNAYDPPLREQPFTVCFVRYALQNSTYAGVFIHGRYKCTRDPKTDKLHKEPRQPSEWQVVPVPHLQIIPVELFDAVYETLHVADRAKRTAMAFLSNKITFGEKRLFAAFGACLKQYRKHKRETTRTTPISAEWISMFVLERLRSLLQDDALEARFKKLTADAFRMAESDLTKMKAYLKTRLAEIEDKLDRYVNRTNQASVSQTFINNRLQALNSEYDRLTAQLATLPAAPTPPVINDKRRDDLLHAFDEFIARLREKEFVLDDLNAADLQIAQAIRGMIRDIHCEQLFGANSMRCVVTFNLGAVFQGINLPANARSATVRFDDIYHVPATVTHMPAFATIASERRYALTDEEFDMIMKENGAAIAEALPTVDLPCLRRALDTQVMLMTISRYWHNLRCVDPSLERLAAFSAMRQLLRQGVWDAILLTIKARLPDRYRQLNTNLLDPYLAR